MEPKTKRIHLANVVMAHNIQAALGDIPDGTVVTPPDIKDDEFHLTISYNESDEDDDELGSHLQRQLNAYHFKVCTVTPGEPSEEVFNELDKCNRVVILISQSYLASNPAKLEFLLSKNYMSEGKVTAVIPVLHNIEAYEVPSYVREVNYLMTSDQYFWTKFLKALTEQVPLTSTIPAGDIANGLAWSYFYGFLALVLPGIKQRVLQSEAAQKGIRIFPKLIILMPESCYCAQDVKTVDSNITLEASIPFKVTLSGNVGRDYSSTLHRVKDPDNNEEFLVLLEYATPLWTMYEMELGRISGLGQEEKHEQMATFKEKLTEILAHPTNKERGADMAVILPFKDRDSVPKRLSREVTKLVREELAKDESCSHSN